LDVAGRVLGVAVGVGLGDPLLPVEVGAEEAEVVVMVAVGPRIAVAREPSDSKPFCETAAHVPLDIFFMVLAANF